MRPLWELVGGIQTPAPVYRRVRRESEAGRAGVDVGRGLRFFGDMLTAAASGECAASVRLDGDTVAYEPKGGEGSK